MRRRLNSIFLKAFKERARELGGLRFINRKHLPPSGPSRREYARIVLRKEKDGKLAARKAGRRAAEALAKDKHLIAVARWPSFNFYQEGIYGWAAKGLCEVPA